MSSGIVLSTVMDGIASAGASVTGVLRTFGYPNEDAIPGDLIVGYPEELELGITFGYGGDRATFPVWFICGLVNDSTTRTFATTLLTGASDFKAAIAAAAISGTTMQVTAARIERVELQTLQHISVRFDVDVISS